VPATALALALAAALVHAVWNLLIARARDSEAATAVAFLFALVPFTPAVALTWELDRGVWPFLAGGAALHVAYAALLGTAYGRADLSVVYPLARGLAPVLVLAVGVVALEVTTSAVDAAGVCAVGVGILLVRGLARPTDERGVAFGIALAACIAGYTLTDKEGVRHASPLTYLELELLVPALAYAAWIVRRKGAAAVRAEVRPPALLAGAGMFGAYALALAALERAPAAPVAAVRETSIVIAAGLAALFLDEEVGPVRLFGAALVAAGVALIALS
jgi:drug/metabolite transporter (DMT)-like permease